MRAAHSQKDGSGMASTHTAHPGLSNAGYLKPGGKWQVFSENRSLILKWNMRQVCAMTGISTAEKGPFRIISEDQGKLVALHRVCMSK